MTHHSLVVLGIIVVVLFVFGGYFRPWQTNATAPAYAFPGVLTLCAILFILWLLGII